MQTVKKNAHYMVAKKSQIISGRFKALGWCLILMVTECEEGLQNVKQRLYECAVSRVRVSLKWGVEL